MYENAIILDGFIINNNTNDLISISVFIENEFMIAQVLQPKEDSTSITFSSSTMGPLIFTVTNLDTGSTTNVATCANFLYEKSDTASPMTLSLKKINDSYILEADFVKISRVTYRNKALIVAKFVVLTEDRGIITSTSPAAIGQSRDVDLTQFGIPKGETLISGVSAGGPTLFFSPTSAIYDPAANFTGVYTVTGTLFKLSFVRNE